MPRRPQREDDYDEILRQQENFLKKNAPAAKVERAERDDAKPAKPEKADAMEVEEPEKQVLFGIVEKGAGKDVQNPHGHPDGFPIPMKLGELSTAGPKKKGKSLFKKRMEQKRQQSGLPAANPRAESVPLVNDAQINLDNAERLAQMSHDEIEAERRELLARLDPSMLEFIRKRRHGKNAETDRVEAKQVKLLPGPVYKTDTGAEVKLPLDKVDKQWVNFSRVEANKLEWMQDVKLRDIQGEVKLRVDFEGNVMNPLDEVSWRKGLHHHGEDEQLPGYTLQELLGLSNSRLAQQRQVAYRALCGVIQNARRRTGDSTLFPAPKLLLQAGLIVVCRRELDLESTQSQEMAIELLHALIGPLVKCDYWPNDPCGLYQKFDESDVESLGDGLIDLSGKELISSLVHMSIFTRFRFLLQGGNISPLCRLQVVEMIEVCARHSLSLANRIFEEAFLVETLIGLLPMASRDRSEAEQKAVLRVFHALGRSGKELAQKILKTKTFEEQLIFAILCDENSEVKSEASRLLSSFIKLGVARFLAQKIIPKLMENVATYWAIIYAFFETAENTRENYERFRSVLKSTSKTEKCYLKLFNLLIQKRSKVQAGGDLSDMAVPNLPLGEIKVAMKHVADHLPKMKQTNMEAAPLPALARSYNSTAAEAFDELADVFNLLALFIRHDRYQAMQYLSKLDLAEFLSGITPSIVLCPETQSLLASLVSMASCISNLVGLDGEIESVIGSLHSIGFRACLLLPAHYAALQLDFLSAYFTGSVFECRSGGVDQSMAQMALDESLRKSSLEDVLPALSSLRALFLSMARKFIPTSLIDRSRGILEPGTCESLVLGTSGLVSTLPADLPFAKLIELGSLYSAVEDVENARNVESQVNDIISSLRFALYLVVHRPGCLPGISGPSLFVRLVSLFLCPPAISLNVSLTKLMGPVLKMALQKTSVVHNTIIPIAGNRSQHNSQFIFFEFQLTTFLLILN